MNKKILIGSIITVAILISVSFTSVIGYRYVESNLKPSPLFAVRSSRAIDGDSKDFTCDYVGKGEETTIHFPASNSRNTQLQKVIEVIDGIDKETFNKFVNFLINRQGKRVKEENIPEIVKALNWLNINPDKIKNFVANEGENKFYTEEGFCETVGFIWIPGCFIALIMGYLIWLVLSFVTIILDCL